MSTKPICQVRTDRHGWLDVPEEIYFELVGVLGREGRILYPTSVVEESKQGDAERTEAELKGGAT